MNTQGLRFLVSRAGSAPSSGTPNPFRANALPGIFAIS